MNELKEQMRIRWDEKGWGYDQAGVHGVHSQEDKDQWIKLLENNKKEGLEILDVGTGTGFIALLAAEHGYKVTAIDWSNTMLSQAKAKAQVKSLPINFIQGVTESLPFEAASFDILTARHVLWTLSEPEQALTEWFRVVKPKGKVLVDYTPRSGEQKNQHYREEVESKLPLNKNIPPEEIVDLFSQAGFSDIQVIKQEKNIKSHSHNHKHNHNHQTTTYLFSCIKP